MPEIAAQLSETPAPDSSASAGVVVRLADVSVRYGRNFALRDVAATFETGAVGLLGPNGAGKSTMIKSLLGFVKPDQGQMTVLGLDVARSPVGLGEARYRNVETYSTGMKQRIKLAQALVHDPDLLFLDEPTNGMDPKGRDEMLELIRDIAHNKGLNLILSSHLLPDVEYACDHVVVMDKGAIATSGPIAGLKGPGGRVFELRIKGDTEQFVGILRAAGLDCHATDEDVMRVFVPNDIGAPLLFRLASEQRGQGRNLRASVPALQDVFAEGG